MGLIVALIIAATTSGFGGPDLPDGDVAFVEDVTDGGDVTQEDFDAALERIAVANGLKQAPEPGTPEYDQAKDSAMRTLLQAEWIKGEGQERGLEVSDTDIENERQNLIEQNFGSEKALEQAIKQQGLSEEEVNEQLTLNVLVTRISEAIAPADPDVPAEDVDEYYESNLDQFTTPESRDVRVILNQDEAQVQSAIDELEQDDSPENWKKVAKEFSTDEATSGAGGLRRALVEGQSEPELDEAVFAADEGVITGPIETASGFYAFEVETITPETTQELDENTRTQIETTLKSQIQQQAQQAFQTDFVAKWRKRTVCGDDYLIDFCGNAPPPADGCTGDDEDEELPVDPNTNEPADELACPAFVPSTKPVPPINAGQTGATGLPQGPLIGIPEAVPLPGSVPLGTPGAPAVPPG